MNKILFLMVVVAVPSISFGGNKEVCEVILKNLTDRVPANESVARIQADATINTSGISNLHELIVRTTMEKGNSSKSSGEVLEFCRAEVFVQTQTASQKRRSGNAPRNADRANAGGTSGGSAGGDLGRRVGSELDLDPAYSALRGNSNQASTAIHEAGNTSSALATCDVLAETESCGITPFTASLAVLGIAALETAKTLPLDTQHCSCIEAKASKEVSSEPERMNQVSKEIGDMNAMIATAFSQKFINDYATHLEDIRYFTKNAKQVFSSRESHQSQEAEKLRCSKPSDFKAAVQRTCGRSITDAQINTKMSKIFGKLGQAQGFQYLSKIDAVVMMNTSDDGKKFKRDDFDIIRNGMVKQDKNIRFADNIVATLLKDNGARRAILATNDIPKEAILKYLTEQIRTDNKFFNRYLSKDLLGEQMFNEMSNQFKDTTIALDVIRGKLDWAMEVHPGFENLMKNKKVFDETSSAIKNSSSSAIDTLETSDNILKPDLIARCENLKNDLAQFLCTDESAYVSSTPKNELRKMITDSGRQHNLVMADLAICRAGNTVVKSGPFAELFVGKADRESDILERLGSTKLADQKNLFTKIMLQNGQSGNSETQRAIASAAEVGYRNRRGLADDSFGRQFEVSDGKKVSFFSPETEESIRNEIAGATAKEEPKTVINNSSTSSQLANNEVPQMASPGYMNNYSSALKDYQESTGAKPATQEKYDPRSELREFLSNKENKESVDRLMKDTDDSRVAELARLREESDRNREQLLRLASDNEKQKLRQMQDQLSDLEEKRAKAVSANVAPEDEEVESDPRSSGRGSRDIASVSSGESSGSNSGNFGGGKAGGSAGGSASSSSAISNARNELSNGITGNGEASSEPVVISAATARSGSLEIKSSELSNEILSFLETEPDVQTLIKMRQSGMIYKYKVMENGREVMKEITIDYTALTDDVKKLIEQKIADSGKAGSEAKRLSAEIKDLKRAYSYNALKIILGEQIKARR